jgi:hypothetical protein
MYDALRNSEPPLTRLPAKRRVRIRNVVIAVSMLAGLTGVAWPASAATAGSNPVGHLERVALSKDHRISASGWALDADQPRSTLAIGVLLDGRLAGTMYTTHARPDVAREIRNAGPRTGFVLVTGKIANGSHRLCLIARNRLGGHDVTFACTAIQIGPKAKPVVNVGANITSYAKAFVGKVGYRDGGTSTKTGFDCSGLTQASYQHVGKTIQRLAQNQYRQFRKISRSSARSGDLVFFHNGSGVYHVGIYAGGNMMVAAADVHYGIRYQTIWSSAVTFGTILH